MTENAAPASGNIERHHGFYSPQLNNSRTIWVWLPPGYENGNEDYPVLYIHDGQNVFDSETSFAGQTWEIGPTLERLIAKRTVRPAIVVAIESTDDRESEYDFAEKGEAYSTFLIDTVRPFVNESFRALTERENTFLMGASLGALISLEILWTRPEFFSGAAGLSMPAFYNDDALFDLLRERPAPRLPINWYMDHGTRGQDRWYGPTAKKLDRVLREKRLPGFKTEYRVFKGAGHTEADWAERMETPLRWLLGS